jgi:hypothetical protein
MPTLSGSLSALSDRVLLASNKEQKTMDETSKIFEEHPTCEYCSVNESEVIDAEGKVACEGCAIL